MTASCSKGKVAELEILSERGSLCSFYSPWAEGLLVRDNMGQDVAVTNDPFGRSSFPTKADPR